MNINMNINKDGLKELQKKFNELTEISKKYSSKGYKKSDKIMYRPPVNEVEEQFVKKANIKHFAFLFFITMVFLFCFILSLVTTSKFIAKILLGMITLIVGYFSIKSISTKDLMIGKAIYKEVKRDTSGKRKSYNYFVTVIDEENKLIYSRIQISKKEYDRVEEGTNILISKGSEQGYIYE